MNEPGLAEAPPRASGAPETRTACAAPPSEPFAACGFHGVVSESRPPARLCEAIEHLTDPGAAVETLHWGRNYLYVTRLATAAGEELPAVVKQFRATGWRARLSRRWRGTKAARSWRVAEALAAAGVETPEPLLAIDSDDPAGPAFYVCRLAEGVTEARYLLRAANAGEAEARFPQFPMGELLDELAALVRRLHEHRIWFRDLTSGNVLLARGDGGRLRLSLVDLNRARVGRRLTVSERTRDLSRMPIFRPEHQERLLRAYWSGDPAGHPRRWQARRLRYLLYHHGFLFKNRSKRWLRGVRGRLVGKLVPRGTHAHIPGPPEDAPSRERVVWDHLSDQPHLHATPLEKLVVRLRDGRAHLEELSAAVGALPRIYRRYRALRRGLYAHPVPFAGAGIALRPEPGDPEGLLDLVDELGAGRVLLRLHPWDEAGRDAEEALARELAGRGLEVTFALPQNRDLVKDPERWRSAVAEIAERFTPYGRSFQVGQAINRSKWGVWTVDEYERLVGAARAELTRARPDVEILGPAVIDFEFHVTAAVLNMRRPALGLDAVSALLYVDRRGAPESSQSGFDTVAKVTLLKAIAETSRNAPSGRCWITEVNWPLQEGPHSPAGRSVAVDEETQADYLARYYLLALGTGLVERVFWWQLVARGYGLVCPGNGESPRRRPAFRTLQTLLRQLEGTTFLGPLPTEPPARLYRFRSAGGEEVVVGWSAAPRPAEADLPAPAAAVITRDGEPEPAPEGTRVTVTPSPRYYLVK